MSKDKKGKPLGQVVGDLIAILFIKGLLSLDEFRFIVGEDNFKNIFDDIDDTIKKEVFKDGNKQGSAPSSM